MSATVQYPNRATQRKNRTAARLRRQEEEYVFCKLYGMERILYWQYVKKYGEVIVVTTATWYREEVDRLVAERGTGYVWMRHWPHYGCGVTEGVVGRESSCFTTQDE